MSTAELTRKQKIFLKCVFYFFKIRGIATLSLNTTKTSKPQQPLFTPSKWGTLFNLLFIGYIVAANIFTIIITYGMVQDLPESMRKFEFDVIIDLVHNSLGTLVSAFVLATFCYKQSASIEIANRMYGIVRHTASLTGRVFDVKSAFWGSLARISLTNMTFTILLIVVAMMESLTYVMLAMSFMMCNLMSHALMMQYSIVLRAIKELFGALNLSLMDICKTSSSCSYVESSRTERSQLQVDYATKLSDLHELYSLLNKLCRDISEFYSAPMLACIVNTFSLLVFFSFHIVRPIVLGNSKATDVTYVLTVIYLMLFVVSLVILTKAVTDTVDEVYIIDF